MTNVVSCSIEIHEYAGNTMKRIISLIIAALLLISLYGCAGPETPARIAATTLPVYEFTSRLCDGTGITVTRLVTENVSCLHDYSLNVRQVRAAEAAEVIVISGAGLEEFMEDLLRGRTVIDSSVGIEILECSESHDHEHGHDHHHHEIDSHIWLSPENAMRMAENICLGLSAQFPEHRTVFEDNLISLISDLDDLQTRAEETLSDLSCRELVTFHDGFSYLAQAFDLEILEAVEEESGSEASAAELKHLIRIVREHDLPAIFTETNGSDSAASVIARETGIRSYPLDMVMSGDSYFDAMYHNIEILKEALG